MAQSHRPRLLLSAARSGVTAYRRELDLRRILRLPATPAPGPATVQALLELEAEIESLRQRPCHETGETWRPAQHVEVMIALVAEARLMAESVPIRPHRRPVAG